MPVFHPLPIMGDYCRMTVYCLPQDTKPFEDLGFGKEGTDEDGVVEMLDPQANHAHCGDLPTNIPWFGRHTEGEEYGPANLACLGDGEVHEQEINIAGDGCVFPCPVKTPALFHRAVAEYHTLYEKFTKAERIVRRRGRKAAKKKSTKPIK